MEACTIILLGGTKCKKANGKAIGLWIFWPSLKEHSFSEPRAHFKPFFFLGERFAEIYIVILRSSFPISLTQSENCCAVYTVSRLEKFF